MTELTSHPNAETLEEVEIMGRTVYVSERNETAFVDFKGELVSMTNLEAWNELMEKGKQEVIDNYEDTKTMEEKEIEKQKDMLREKIRDFQRELGDLERKI